MTKYLSKVFVETPDGIQEVDGPSQEIRDHGGWYMGPSDHSLLFNSIQKIMERGYYQYALGKWGRVVSINVFDETGNPVSFH